MGLTKTKELPQLTSEFVDLSKAYFRQETVGQAKLLGRHAGFGFAGAALMAIGLIFLAVAGVRGLIHLMPGEPTHRMWSGLAYVLGALGAAGIAGIVVALGAKK